MWVNVKAKPLEEVSLYTHMLKAGNIADIDKPELLNLTHQSYPNPFRETTNIQYTIPEAGKVTIRVYDNLGREVKTLVEHHQMAGEHQAEFTKNDADGPGVYTYTIRVECMNRIFTARGSLIHLK